MGTIGRMYQVFPTSGKHFYLQLLLTVDKGATSFKHLHTVHGTCYPTFKAVCAALGLLEDDRKWIQCLEEASVMLTGFVLQALFVSMLLNCTITKPDELWICFYHHICNNLQCTLTCMGILNTLQDTVYDYGLWLLNECCINIKGKDLTHFGLPLPQQNWGERIPNPLIAAQHNYNVPTLQAEVAANQASFNCIIFDKVMQSVTQKQGKSFFVHSGSGGGKPFVCNTIASAVCANLSIALYTASTGIASLLLHGGSTGHLHYKIPIPIFEDSFCDIGHHTDTAELLLEVNLIIWDEIPMQHRWGIEAVERTLHCL